MIKITDEQGCEYELSAMAVWALNKAKNGRDAEQAFEMLADYIPRFSRGCVWKGCEAAVVLIDDEACRLSKRIDTLEAFGKCGMNGEWTYSKAKREHAKLVKELVKVDAILESLVEDGE